MIESGPKVEELRVIQKVHGVCFDICIQSIFFLTLIFCKNNLNFEHPFCKPFWKGMNAFNVNVYGPIEFVNVYGLAPN